MSTRADVTEKWYDHLRSDLVLRDHARVMLDRENEQRRCDVLIVACVAINARLWEDVHHLGGLAAVW